MHSLKKTKKSIHSKTAGLGLVSCELVAVVSFELVAGVSFELVKVDSCELVAVVSFELVAGVSFELVKVDSCELVACVQDIQDVKEEAWKHQVQHHYVRHVQ